MNIGVHRFFWIDVSGFIGYNPSIGISGSRDSDIFSFLRNFHIDFHSGCANLPFQQQCTRVPLSPQPSPHLLFVDLFIMAILVNAKWYFIVVLIYISRMASGVGHPFICLWAPYLSSLEKCLFWSFAQILIGLLVFLVWNHVSSLHILEIKPLSEVWNTGKMFPHTVGSLFILMLFSLPCRSFLFWWNPIYLFFPLCPLL